MSKDLIVIPSVLKQYPSKELAHIERCIGELNVSIRKLHGEVSKIENRTVRAAGKALIYSLVGFVKIALKVSADRGGRLTLPRRDHEEVEKVHRVQNGYCLCRDWAGRDEPLCEQGQIYRWVGDYHSDVEEPQKVAATVSDLK